MTRRKGKRHDVRGLEDTNDVHDRCRLGRYFVEERPFKGRVSNVESVWAFSPVPCLSWTLLSAAFEFDRGDSRLRLSRRAQLDEVLILSFRTK